MEPYQHQRVLLSNVPAASSEASLRFDYSYGSNDASQHATYFGHHEASHSIVESRSSILQDTSGNAGYLEEFAYHHDSIQLKHEIKAPSSPHSPPLYSAEAAIKGELEHRRRPRFTIGALNLDRCELESPRYRLYREKQRKAKKGPPGPWTDDVEAAFQNAVRLYAGRGRKKEELLCKLSGGNEFISHEIKLQTGKLIDRKMVSSHIQVLKGLLKDNPKWMRLIHGIDDLGKSQRSRRDGVTRSARQSGGRIKREPQDHPHRVDALYRRSAPPQIPAGPTIRSLSFDMRLCEDCAEEQGRHSPKVHHIYTLLQSEMASECQYLNDLQKWQFKFPGLDPYDKGGCPTPLFLFEAGLRLIDEFILERSKIAINLSIRFTHGSIHDRWFLQTKIHHRSDLVYERSHENLAVSALGDGSLRINLAFGAHYWARLFGGWNEVKMAARRTGTVDHIRQVEQDQRQYLERLHVTQELWTTSKDDSTNPVRMAVLLWKFHQTVQNQTPTTSWRRLIPPPAQQFDQMLNPGLEQLPLKSEDLLYQSAIPEKPGLGGIPEIPKPNVWRSPFPGDTPQNPRSLDQPASENSSPKTSIHGDGGSSFPSSLATSFDPPSCDLNYPASLSQQGSSFDSQDGVSMYPYLDTSPQQEGNFDPQLLQMDERTFEAESLHHQGRELYAVDETTYYSQDQSQPFGGNIPELPSFDGTYDSQMMEEMPVLEPAQQLIAYETLVPQQLDMPDHVVASEHHHASRIAEVMSPGTQDEVPLAAPRAQSISQAHILQLQHFEEIPPGFVLPEDQASPTNGPSPDGGSIAQQSKDTAVQDPGQPPGLHKEELADWELTFSDSLDVAPPASIDDEIAPESRGLPNPTPAADGGHDETYEFLRGAMERLEDGWEPLEGAMPSEEESQRWVDEMARGGRETVKVEVVDTVEGVSQESIETLGFIKVEKVEEDGQGGGRAGEL